MLFIAHILVVIFHGFEIKQSSRIVWQNKITIFTCNFQIIKKSIFKNLCYFLRCLSGKILLKMNGNWFLFMLHISTWWIPHFPKLPWFFHFSGYVRLNGPSISGDLDDWEMINDAISGVCRQRISIGWNFKIMKALL